MYAWAGVPTFPFPDEGLAAGGRLGPYLLEELLGEGGMGVVFRASREDGRERVALKVLRRELSRDESYRRRFLHEARAAAEVRHCNLVAILDAGEYDGRYFLATAYVVGSDVEQRVRREGALPVEDVLRVAGEIGSGLDALHARGVIHRDVKASNILLAQDGPAMLTDFGLAKGRGYTVLTKPGEVMGTVDYLAPELIRGEPATTATDIYALACTVYECVSGKTPFAHANMFQIGLGHLQDEPADPGGARDDWSPALSEALLSGLKKDPAARPPTATAFASALRSAAAQRTSSRT